MFRQTSTQSLDSLVGRGQDLSRLRTLSGTHRLVTLVGPGGIGKTRLALEFAPEARFVELGSISDPDLVLPAIATALGVDDRGRPAIETLQDLVVLDNCEHLAEVCALVLEDLLRRCPGLRVVATSREALRVPGEVVYRVGELSLPGDNAESRPEILRSAAVRLFVERATAADPDLELTDAAVVLVAQICRELDGLPLAIELAARRAGALSLQQIRDGLHAQLLTDGPRTAPARLRELSSAIEWSHRLLDAEERLAFSRLSVLAGGFDLAGASAVCGFDAARVVSNLEAKSLVVRARDTGRFRQLNLIRAYAFERLRESGELDEVQDRAADWLVSVAGPVGGTLVLGEELGRELGGEHENLVAAVAHTASRCDDRHVVLAVALVRCWYRHGRLTPGRQLLADVLERVPDTALRGDLLSLSAVLACLQGDLAAGASLAREAVRLAGDSSAALVNALDADALALMCAGDLSAALVAYRECVAVVDTLGRPVDAAVTRNRLGWALVQAGEIDEAAEVIAAAIPVLRAANSHLASVLHTEGAMWLGTGDWDAAEQAFGESLRLSPLDGWFLPYPVEGLAVVAEATGDPHRALRLAAAATQARRGRLRAPEPYWQDVVDSTVATARERIDMQAAAVSEASGRLLRGHDLVAYALRDNVNGPLTPRELEIAELVAAGRTNREISLRLAVSTATVAAHLNSIRDKLGLRSRTRIALWVRDRVS